MFIIHNFNDAERDVVSAFAAVRHETAASDYEIGLRYVDVSTNAGEVSFAGLMDMMGTNAGQLANAFNAADRELSYGNLEAMIKYSRQMTRGLPRNVDIGPKTRAPSYQELYLWLPLQATGGLAYTPSWHRERGILLDFELCNQVLRTGSGGYLSCGIAPAAAERCASRDRPGKRFSIFVGPRG